MYVFLYKACLNWKLFVLQKRIQKSDSHESQLLYLPSGIKNEQKPLSLFSVFAFPLRGNVIQRSGPREHQQDCRTFSDHFIDNQKSHNDDEKCLTTSDQNCSAHWTVQSASHAYHINLLTNHIKEYNSVVVLCRKIMKNF